MPNNLLCDIAIIYGAGLALIAILDLVRRIVGAPLPGPDNFLVRLIVVLLAPLVIGLGVEHGLRVMNDGGYDASAPLKPTAIKACVHKVIKKKHKPETQSPGGNSPEQRSAKDSLSNSTQGKGYSGLTRTSEVTLIGILDRKNWWAKFNFQDFDDKAQCLTKVADNNVSKFVDENERKSAKQICEGAGWIERITETEDSNGKINRDNIVVLKLEAGVLGKDGLAPNDIEAVCHLGSTSKEDDTGTKAITELIVAESTYNYDAFETPIPNAFGRLLLVSIEGTTATITGVAKYPSLYDGEEYSISYREFEGMICQRNTPTDINKSAETISIIMAERGNRNVETQPKEYDAGELVRFHDISFDGATAVTPAQLSVKWRARIRGPKPLCANVKGNRRSIGELHYDAGSEFLWASATYDNAPDHLCSTLYRICTKDKDGKNCKVNPFAEDAMENVFTADDEANTLAFRNHRFEGLTTGRAKGTLTGTTEQEGVGEVVVITPNLSDTDANKDDATQ